MKNIRTSLFLVFFLSVNTTVWAAPITPSQAIAAARHFFTSESNLRAGTAPEVTILSTHTSAAGDTLYYYVVANGQTGWIILSGDDRIQPVIAYSTSAPFGDNSSPSFDWWMSEKETEIKALLAAHPNDLRSTPAMHREWTDLLAETTTRSASAYSPGTDLMAGIAWQQWGFANTGNKPAGCVATAMGQVLKYWGRKNHLTHLQGAGAYEYIDHADNNALRSVDYSTKTYNLYDMPSNTESPEISKLLYDLGVGVRMAYTADGSGALNMMIPSALFCHFGFKPAEYGEATYYTPQRWKVKVMQEIAAERPVIYGGVTDAGAGHSFVISGYKDNGSTFYFNWGWNGHRNGWYALTLTGVDGEIAYSNGQDAVFGIEPYAAGESFPYSISGITMISEKNDNCYMSNKFTSGTTAGRFKIKLKNNSNTKDIPLTARFFSNSANGQSVSYVTMTYSNIPANFNEEGVLDAEDYLEFWNDESFADLNCDFGVRLTNSDNKKYIVDIGRNPHVIQRVSSFQCETATSFPEAEAAALVCYPNPARDHLFIQTGERITPDAVSIINIFGERLTQTAVETSPDDTTLRINISGLPDGVYFVVAGKQTARFIKR